MRLALASCLLLAGCHLDDLLNPGPPPAEEKCFRTLTMTWVNSWGDTTVMARGIRTACVTDDPYDGK